MWLACNGKQVIAGICLAVWLINIPRFNDPLHGGWVRKLAPVAWLPLCTCMHLVTIVSVPMKRKVALLASCTSVHFTWHRLLHAL